MPFGIGGSKSEPLPWAEREFFLDRWTNAFFKLVTGKDHHGVGYGLPPGEHVVGQPGKEEIISVGTCGGGKDSKQARWVKEHGWARVSWLTRQRINRQQIQRWKAEKAAKRAAKQRQQGGANKAKTSAAKASSKKGATLFRSARDDDAPRTAREGDAVAAHESAPASVEQAQTPPQTAETTPLAAAASLGVATGSRSREQAINPAATEPVASGPSRAPVRTVRDDGAPQGLPPGDKGPDAGVVDMPRPERKPRSDVVVDRGL